MNKKKIGLYCVKVAMTTDYIDGKPYGATVFWVPDFISLNSKETGEEVYVHLPYRTLSASEFGKINKRYETDGETNKTLKGCIRTLHSDAVVKNIDLFQVGANVTIRAKSVGKGFQGAMKVHHFAGGRASHGENKAHRTLGSTGQQNTERVFKGKKMPKRMGFDYVTVKNLTVLHVDKEKRMIIVKGSTPGKNAIKGSRQNLSFISLSNCQKGENK